MKMYMNMKVACNAFDKSSSNEFSFLLRKQINLLFEIFRHYFFLKRKPNAKTQSFE